MFYICNKNVQRSHCTYNIHENKVMAIRTNFTRHLNENDFLENLVGFAVMGSFGVLNIST